MRYNKLHIFLIAQIIILFNLICVSGQDIRVLNKYEEFNMKKKPYEFNYLDNKNDTSTISMKIQTIKCTFENSRRTDLAQIFTYLWKYSNSISANSFKIDSCDFNLNNDSSVIYLTLCYTSASMLKENLKLLPKNTAFIIGKLNFRSKINFDVIVNNPKRFSCTLNPLEFLAINYSNNDTITIETSWNIGKAITLSGKENQLSEFFSIYKFILGYAESTTGGINVGNISLNKIYCFKCIHRILQTTP